MNFLSGRAGAVLSLTLLSACVTPPILQPQVYSAATPAAYDEVWADAVEWFAVNNIPIETVEKESGILAAETARGTPDEILAIADCGRTGLHPPTVGTVRYNVFLRDIGPARSLRVNTDIVLYTRDGFGGLHSFDCISNGTLETRILAEVMPGPPT